MSGYEEKLGDLLRKVTEGNETALEVVQGLDGSKGLQITRRRVNPEPPPEPIKAESPRRAHSFHDVCGFIHYLTKYGTANTVVLADVKRVLMQATLDERAEKGLERLTFVPMWDPIFDPWRMALGRNMDMDVFVSFFMENQEAMLESDGRSQLASILQQLRISKTVDIRKGMGPKATNGVMVTMQVDGGDKQFPVDLPTQFTITCPIFIGRRTYALPVNLLLIYPEGEVQVRLTCPMLLRAQVQEFQEMVNQLQLIEAEGKGFTVALGEIKDQPWQYLEGAK